MYLHLYGFSALFLLCMMDNSSEFVAESLSSSYVQMNDNPEGIKVSILHVETFLS